MSTKQLTITLGDFAAKDSRNAAVLRRSETLLCYDANKPGQLQRVLEQSAPGKAIALQELYTWDIEMLIDYIIDFHHQYVKDNAVIIYDLAQKVMYKHSENHPEFKKLASQIFLFLHGLLNHLTKEEKLLFPEMKQLIKNKKITGTAIYTTSDLIKDAVRLMRKQHLVAEEDLNVFRELTNDYKVPKDTCALCNLLFKKMSEFENDLLMHIYLENKILFPKLIAINEALK
jgi:regulator of cell morphogenesis and NO signaling